MNEQFPFQMVPMPMMPPWLNRQPEYHGNEVPARVRVAMEFLQTLTAKGASVRRTGGGAFDGMSSSLEIDGQELKPVEQQTQAAALLMLQEYFNGELEASEWEEAACKPEGSGPIALIDCPSCMGREKMHQCAFCQGRGKVAITRADR